MVMTDREILHSSKSDNWFTPSNIVEAARACMGSIDLDPASCEEANQIVQADVYFDIATDGFSAKAWFGNIFLNPPGGKAPLGNIYRTRSSAVAWWRKLIEEYRRSHVKQAIFVGFSLEILQASQGNVFWPSPLEYPICVPEQRIRFSNAPSPTHGNVIVGLGINPEDFKACFSPIGQVKI